MLGLPGWKIIESEDDLEVLTMQAVVRAAESESRIRMKNQAVLNANSIGEVLRHMFKGRR